MIKVGRYKNWREVCKAMGWKTTGGTYKEARKKDLNTLCKCHQEGNVWIVEEVYEVQLERVDLRVNGNNTGKLKEYEQFNVSKENWFDVGVYRIIDDDNNCYIGSTTRSFRERFIEHYKGFQYNTKELIDNGGVFEILKIMNYSSEEEIREKENEFLTLYKFKYNVVNKLGYVSGFTPKRKEILIDEDKYELAIKLLQDNGLL